MNSQLKKQSVINAVLIGVLCSVSYLAVYIARNILGAVTPQMLADGFNEAYVGRVSSVYFVCYAVGQLINGAIGDKIKAKYMVAAGLFMAGTANLLFSVISVVNQSAAICVYGFTGFFLSMIYGPMTKIVAENTEPVYTTRCTLGYTFASFLGSPCAGVFAAILTWQSVFRVSSGVLGVMSLIFFVTCSAFERKGLIKYNQYTRKKDEGGSIKVLIQHRIIKFTLISILTGVVRTSVVFWMPTYLCQYLGFSAESSVSIFAAATLVIATTTFIAVFIYELLKHNMDLMLLLMFSCATAFFVLVYFVSQPVLNIIFLVLAIMASGGAATMLYSRYCPSLRDTGMVSTATGFLDFVSYMSAAAASSLFANAVSAIGWGKLILVWAGLMAVGIIVSLPYKKFQKNA